MCGEIQGGVGKWFQIVTGTQQGLGQRYERFNTQKTGRGGKEGLTINSTKRKITMVEKWNETNRTVIEDEEVGTWKTSATFVARYQQTATAIRR